MRQQPAAAAPHKNRHILNNTTPRAGLAGAPLADVAKKSERDMAIDIDGRPLLRVMLFVRMQMFLEQLKQKFQQHNYCL